MRPTADTALRGMRENLQQMVVPRVTDPEALRQLQSMSGILAKLADDWSDEPRKVREANERLFGLVASGATALDAAGDIELRKRAANARETVASAPEDDASMAGMYRRQDVLNAALVTVLEGLEQAAARTPSEDVDEARAAIYRFLKSA